MGTQGNDMISHYQMIVSDRLSAGSVCLSVSLIVRAPRSNMRPSEPSSTTTMQY